ncbi:MAG: GtrA family protein [Paludibacteraceae bacterium]|nr:GtrA family protein [Paludibacteraceae bacterium]
MSPKETTRFLKFTLISASAGIIELGSFTLLNELLHWRYWPCYLIALTMSVLWNFTINRRFTFHSNANVPKAMALVVLYYLFFTPASTWLGDWLAEDIGWNEYLVTACMMILNLITEFAYQRFVVYRNKVDTNGEQVGKDK